MLGIKRFRTAYKASYVPARVTDDAGTLQCRVEQLTDDERQVYKWLRECFSKRWIAETLLITKPQLQKLIDSMCYRLGVHSVREMLRVYNCVPIPTTRLVKSEDIDAYVEKRTEAEIQELLRKTSQKTK